VTPTPSFKVTVKFKGEYLANGASDPLYVWFYARVFGVGGSNGAICGSINPRWRLTAILDIQKWPQLRNRFDNRHDVWF